MCIYIYGNKNRYGYNWYEFQNVLGAKCHVGFILLRVLYLYCCRVWCVRLNEHLVNFFCLLYWRSFPSQRCSRHRIRRDINTDEPKSVIRLHTVVVVCDTTCKFREKTNNTRIRYSHIYLFNRSETCSILLSY